MEGAKSMNKIKKILCPLDLSGYSKEVAAYAADMAKTFEAEVILLNVVPFTEDEIYVRVRDAHNTLREFAGKLTLSSEELLNDMMKEYFADVQVSKKIAEGDPAKEILATSDEVGADLIIMGTHGKKGVDRFLFGSVAEKVVRNSQIPVLTVRPGNEK